MDDEEEVDAEVVLAEDDCVDNFDDVDTVDVLDDIVEVVLTARAELCLFSITRRCSSCTALTLRADPSLLLSSPWRGPATSPARLAAPT